MSNDHLYFSQNPVVELCTNVFINVPKILVVDGVPLIETMRDVAAGFTTRFSIYHNDGSKLAVVDGARLFLTEIGQKAGLSLRHEPHLTVCQIGSTPVFEVQRKEAAALKTEAELYSPTGIFVKVRGSLDVNLASGKFIAGLLGRNVKRCVFNGCDTGVTINSDGGIGFGLSNEALGKHR